MAKKETDTGKKPRFVDGVWQVKKGVVRLKVNYFDAVKGKNVSKQFTFATKTEAKQRKPFLKAELEQKSLEQKAALEAETATEGDMLVGVLVKYHLDHWHGSPTTKDSYVSCAKHIYDDSISKIKISELKKVKVQEFIDALAGKPRQFQTKDGEIQFLSPKTVRNTFCVLQGALQLAVDYEWIPKNPAAKCKLPVRTKPEIHVFQKQECKQFCKNIEGDKYENLYLIDLFTGMRASELRGLSWDAVDFQQGTISICQQIIKVKGQNGVYRFKRPKYNKIRTLKPAARVMKLLQQQKKEQEIQQERIGVLWNNKYNLVFTDAIGEPIAVSTLRRDFKKKFTAMNRPEMVLHDLRHTYAVNSLLAGEDVKSLSANMGHSSVAFTLDTYAKYTSDMRDISAERQQQFINTLFDDNMDESTGT